LWQGGRARVDGVGTLQLVASDGHGCGGLVQLSGVVSGCWVGLAVGDGEVRWCGWVSVVGWWRVQLHVQLTTRSMEIFSSTLYRHGPRRVIWNLKANRWQKSGHAPASGRSREGTLPDVWNSARACEWHEGSTLNWEVRRDKAGFLFLVPLQLRGEWVLEPSHSSEMKTSVNFHLGFGSALFGSDLSVSPVQLYSSTHQK